MAIIELIVFIRMSHLEVDLDLIVNKKRIGNRIALHDRFRLDDDGSKIENRFIIIFS